MALPGPEDGAAVARSAAPLPHVFISFASEDADLAHRMVERLEALGLRCWISDRDIEPGASYPAAITAAVATSGALLLLLTASSTSSPHVLRETEMAFSARRPILPVRVAGATPTPDLEYFLSRSQWLDIGSTLDEAECARLTSRLRQLLSGRMGVVSDDLKQWRIRAAVAACVLALTGGGWWIWNGRSADVEPTVQLPPPAPPTTGTGATPATPPAPGASIVVETNPRDGQPYVFIPAGRFVMGCSAGDAACDMDEQPTRNITLARGFWLGRTEVTRAAYRASRGERSGPADASGNLPVANVSWADAKAYCSAIGGRLPTETEWEYAARGGTTTRYYDAPAESAWFEDNADGAPHPVATRRPNAFQLYDMLGNVSEWVRDRYYNRYDDSSDPSAIEEPLAPNASATARGGSWVSDAEGVRASRRLQMEPAAEEPHVGFRCALDEPAP